jgi:hypothetical protein
MGRIGGLRVGNKIGFNSLGKYDTLCLLGTFILFQTIIGVRHEDPCSYFILEATNKQFLEEGINHSLHSKNQLFEGSDKIFHCFRLFQLSQMA